MKQTMRSFSIGLLTAAFILFIVYYFFDESVSTEIENDVNEMIPLIEAEGYRIVTEDEYIKLSVQEDEEDTEEDVNKDENTENNDQEDNQNEEDKSDEETEQDKDTDNQEPETILVTIAPGMASTDISDMLESENLIDDASEFNSYLLEHDYALYVRMGDHELRTDMSFYEIAETLTN